LSLEPASLSLYRRLRDAAREMSAQAAETDVRAIPDNAIERKFVGAGMRESEKFAIQRPSSV